MSTTVLAIPTQVEIVEIFTDQDWREAFEFKVKQSDGTIVLRDFTGSHVVGALKSRTGTDRIDLTNIGGAANLDLTTNVVTTVVPRDTIKDLTPGLYDLDLIEVTLDSQQLGLLRGKRRVDSGPRP